MLTSTTPYNRPLDGGLVMKSIADLHDVERLAVFNGQIFGQGVAAMTRSFILRHPATRPHHWLYVEAESSGQIVSSLCLIPWTWRYEDVTLKSGEMGIVSTLESFRNRGIVRALIGRFKELLHEEAFDLSHIQGIPYFYRQFGYEYALPLEAQWQIELRNIPDAPDGNSYGNRPATVQDIPVLMRLYDDTTAILNISALRSADIWKYMLEDTAGTDIEGETWLMLDADEQPTGYFRLSLHGFGEGLIVSETSRLSVTSAGALLRWLKATTLERNKPYIRLNLPDSNDLLKAARCWGAHDSGAYTWQIHMPDVVRLLRKLTPVLERRIAASSLAGLSRTVILNLYQEAFEMQFERGKLLAVNSIGFSDGGEIRLPPNLLTPLVLGYRSREELRYMYPDVNIWGHGQQLVDTLFPKMESFIYTNY